MERFDVSEALGVDELGKMFALQLMGSYQMRQFIKNGCRKPSQIYVVVVP